MGKFIMDHHPIIALATTHQSTAVVWIRLRLSPSTRSFNKGLISFHSDNNTTSHLQRGGRTSGVAFTVGRSLSGSSMTLPRRDTAEQPCRAAPIPTRESRSSILPSASRKLKVGAPAPIGFDSVTNGFSLARDKSGATAAGVPSKAPPGPSPSPSAPLPPPPPEDEPQRKAIPFSGCNLSAACLHLKKMRGRKEDSEGITGEKMFPLHSLVALAASLAH